MIPTCVFSHEREKPVFYSHSRDKADSYFPFAGYGSFHSRGRASPFIANRETPRTSLSSLGFVSPFPGLCPAVSDLVDRACRSRVPSRAHQWHGLRRAIRIRAGVVPSYARLTPNQIQNIARWIDEGARHN